MHCTIPILSLISYTEVTCSKCTPETKGVAGRTCKPICMASIDLTNVVLKIASEPIMCEYS